jgi:hypothetical protein
MIVNMVLSILILGVLVVISTLFNSYIDSRDAGDGFDGETAVWVALGNFYTIVIGVGGLVSIWGGWKMAQYAIVIAFISFVASGLPMMFGDANRTKRRRTGVDK